MLEHSGGPAVTPGVGRLEHPVLGNRFTISHKASGCNRTGFSTVAIDPSNTQERATLTSGSKQSRHLLNIRDFGVRHYHLGQVVRKISVQVLFHDTDSQTIDRTYRTAACLICPPADDPGLITLSPQRASHQNAFRERASPAGFSYVRRLYRRVAAVPPSQNSLTYAAWKRSTCCWLLRELP